jgi:hypothetical protein
MLLLENLKACQSVFDDAPLSVMILWKFHLFTVQLRHFTGENIARTAKQSPSNCFEFIAASRIPLGFLQDGDVGVGVFEREVRKITSATSARRVKS